MLSLISSACSKGFSMPHLHSVLYAYAGGSNLKGSHTERYLRDLGLISGDSELTDSAQQLFRHMHKSYTGKPYIWAQEVADAKKVQAVLHPTPFK